MEGPGELRCVRHQKPTRITCVTCDTPICPDCAIRTPVGYKCPDHATKPAPPRSSRFGVVVVVLGVVAILGFLQLARSTGKGDPATPPCPTETAPDVGIGSQGGAHWTEMAPSGLCGRYDAAVAWTGTELIVWGGENCAGTACPTDLAPHLSDGAAYRPTTNSWRRLAESPLPNREAAATVWTGTEMLVWGGTTGQTLLADGAAYDPARDRWRALSRSPLAPRTASTAVWTGREMLVWGGSGAADGAAYDPAADRWRPLAPGPLAGRSGSVAAWTGKEMVVWGGHDAPPGQQALQFADGATYDPGADRWRSLAASPLTGRIDPAAVWTGQELIVWGGVLGGSVLADDGAAYSPATDRWRSMSPPPVAGRASPAAAWSGREMLIWGGLAAPGGANNGPLDRIIERRTLLSPIGDGAAYDPATDRWRTLEPVPLLGRLMPIAAWDGDGMIVWGGLVVVSSPASSAEGVRYTP